MAFTGDRPTTKRDTYFSLWSVTDEGIRNVERLRATIEKASAMIREHGGECRLYVSVGGAHDMIGVAKGIDDEKIVEIQHAIQSFGTLRTTFVKTKEFSLKEYRAHIKGVNKLRAVRL